MNNKLQVISNLFEEKEIRSVWNSEKSDYYFSIIDVVSALTESKIPRRYWSDLKKKLELEGSQLYENIVQLKIKSSKDGKYYKTDTLNTEGILRLIESIPSPKAEPFKLWLASLGKREIDSIFDPSIGIDKMIDYYQARGYTLEWVLKRTISIIERKKLTKTWENHGISDSNEYAILTNEIYKSWSGMTAIEYKKYKGIRKESLRDNMSDLEVLLTSIGETATRELTKVHNPIGLEQNKLISEVGGNIANNTKKDLERKLGKNIVNESNNLNMKYIEDRKQ
ncbi:MAG: Bro-N domain-containing protein [Bacilli bacterium]|nr:Bro-N domain-containing protein [Bacilli bacterium]